MKKLKKILILYASSNKNIVCRPFVNESTQVQIERLFKEGEIAGIKFYRTPINLFNSNKKCFDKAWSFDKNKWIIVDNIVPDIVFDKVQHHSDLISAKNKIASIYKFVNDPVFDEIANNKFITYSLFRNRMPKSYLVYNKKNIENKLKYFKRNKIIVKPIIGSGGVGVRVLSKKEVTNIKVEKPCLLQEFIDSSFGINNIIKECHDLRIIIFDKKIFGVYIRIPKSGSFLANIAQGGRRIVLKKEEIPKEVLVIIKEIINKFNCFNNLFYSADFIFDKKQKPYLLEINSRPGFGAVNYGVENEEYKIFLDSYYKRMIKYFLEIKID